MALTTKTIQNTIDWAKRFAFERNPAIGNSLEPALTSANIVIQTILAPPMDWWWNNLEIAFTCNPTAATATSSAVSISNGTITVTANNSFVVGQPILPSALGTLTDLNGELLIVATASSSQFTALTTLGNGTDTTGTFTSLSTQDYQIPVPNFSHIEHASVMDLNASGSPVVYTPNQWFELTVKNNLSLESAQARPTFISPHVEDGNGNVTFRIQPAPDKPYPISLHIQQTAPLITSLNQTWAPLPDFMEYIYQWGFMALMWQFADDPRSAIANNNFKAGIMARAEGLTDEERNIFLNNWEYLYKNPQVVQIGTNARMV